MFGYPYGEESFLLRLVFSPNSAYLACRGGHSFAAWNLSTKKPVVAAFNRKTDVDDISFSADSSNLISCTHAPLYVGHIPPSNASTLGYWKTSNGKLAQRIKLANGGQASLLPPTIPRSFSGVAPAPITSIFAMNFGNMT